jgi:hypothetical protein
MPDFIYRISTGEPVMRVYRGTGKALVCWTPYWNRQIADMIRH